MEKDNEKLFEALDLIAYVNRSSNFAMLPSDPKDERPFLLLYLSRQIQTAIHAYMEDSDNAERVDYYKLKGEVSLSSANIDNIGVTGIVSDKILPSNK